MNAQADVAIVVAKPVALTLNISSSSAHFARAMAITIRSKATAITTNSSFMPGGLRDSLFSVVYVVWRGCCVRYSYYVACGEGKVRVGRCVQGSARVLTDERVVRRANGWTTVFRNLR